MAFQYNYLEDVDSSQNRVVINKFNKLLEKNNFNTNLQLKLDTINSEFKEDKTPYDKVINETRWNTYYYKKYKQQTKLLVFIIFICIIMIVLTKLRSSYFDDKAYALIMGVVLAFAFIYVIYGLWDLYLKDNKNFDEYDYSKYGGSKPTITDVKFTDISNVDVDISNCLQKQLTPETINSSFLNKYF